MDLSSYLTVCAIAQPTCVRGPASAIRLVGLARAMRHGGAALYRPVDRRASEVDGGALALRISGPGAEQTEQGRPDASRGRASATLSSQDRRAPARSWASSTSRRTHSPTAAGIFNTDAATSKARRLAAEGADIIDVGGESTRPGATPRWTKSRSSPASSRSWRLGRAPRCRCRSTPTRPAWRRARSSSAPCSINDVWGLQKRPRDGGASWPRRGRRSSSCTTGPKKTRPSTSWRTCAGSSSDRWRSPRRAGIPQRAHHPRSRHRLRQDLAAEH